MRSDYPPEAYAPDGTPWWQLKTWPGSTAKFGDEPRIAAWLAFNKEIGELFTTAEIRDALGDALELDHRNEKEHLQRRLRQLRDHDGWLIPSKKYDRTLPVGHYRLDKVGWHPALGDRPRRPSAVSAKTRRLVLIRDGSRCVICGVGAGEPNPGRPDTVAAMTVGHVSPGSYGGSGDLSNFRTECAECNEAIRSGTGLPESFDVALESVQSLKMAELTRLYDWLVAGHRTRDRLDQIYDRIRMMSPGNKDRIVRTLGSMLGHPE
jgi:hypothetical protein